MSTERVSYVAIYMYTFKIKKILLLKLTNFFYLFFITERNLVIVNCLFVPLEKISLKFKATHRAVQTTHG